jgi:hypothetical protein
MSLGSGALCARLLRLAVALVALKRPDGLLSERLLDAAWRWSRCIPTS